MLVIGEPYEGEKEKRNHLVTSCLCVRSFKPVAILVGQFKFERGQSPPQLAGTLGSEQGERRKRLLEHPTQGDGNGIDALLCCQGPGPLATSNIRVGFEGSGNPGFLQAIDEVTPGSA